jgi:uncharacterized protein with HEPN domain
MYDQNLTVHILDLIHKSAQIIMNRFESVHSASDFTDSSTGMEKLDSICMQLIVIGESIKNLDKITGGILLKRYPDIDWKKAMGLRDIITHHYFDVNADATYNVCKTKIPLLNKVLLRIIRDQQWGI